MSQAFFDVRSAGRASVIAFRNNLVDLANQPETALSELSDFMFANECRKLTIDLSGVKYLPSSLLGALAQLVRGGAAVHLTHAAQDVIDVLEVTKLSRLLKAYPGDVPSDLDGEEPPAAKGASTSSGLLTTPVLGYLIPCSVCQTVLKIDKHALGHSQKCTACDKTIHVTADLFRQSQNLFAACPHCHRELRISRAMLNQHMRCSFCSVEIEVRLIV